MITRESVWEKLQLKLSEDGRTQYDFSKDKLEKFQEIEILKEFESEGLIRKIKGALAFALYQVY